jgi:cobaltochelatase CobS
MQMNSAVSMKEFGVNTNVQAPAFPADHEFIGRVPPRNNAYNFRDDLLRKGMNWLFNPRGDSLLLIGPTGSGKSSLIEQIAARLNWPCVTVSAHSRMEMPELTGFNLPVTDPVSGDLNTKFVDGPLTMAMRNGFLFVLDEYDTLDPSVAVGLHAVLEGRPLVIAENGGELVKPHENFRFIACGNTAGQGDDNGLYAATMQQNLASLDRFRVFEIGYLPIKEEVKTLLEVVPGLPEELANKMVKVANSVRQQHQGHGGAYLSVTLSTRTIIRWANIAVDYVNVGAPFALQSALEESLLNRCDKTQRIAITKIAESVFGGEWVLPS